MTTTTTRRKNVFSATMTLLALTGVMATAACSPEEAAPPPDAVSPIPAAEQARTIAAMKPPKRARPVIAVLAQNDGTETTDFIVPYAVLAESGAADVLAVATEARSIKLTPALTIEPHTTTAAFDTKYPDGADYVIVPRIDKTADPAAVSWIQAQAGKGVTIVGVCSGVKTVAAAGLVNGRMATGHWYDIEGLRRDYPTMQWVRDRRYVADRGVITTTGVSASLPVSLALVEAIAGWERTAALAKNLGVTTWDARHDSSAFWLDPTSQRTAERNRALGANPELWAVPAFTGVDDISLSFMADAWSRTFLSKALAVTAKAGPIKTRRGLVLLPDAVAGQDPASLPLAPPPAVEPAKALPEALAGIAGRYGNDTASFVALQLEYAWQPK